MAQICPMIKVFIKNWKEQYTYLFLTKPMMPPVATSAPKAYPATSCFFISPIAVFLKCTKYLGPQIVVCMFVFLTIRLANLQVATIMIQTKSGSFHISNVELGEIRDIIKINYRNVQGQLVKYRYHMFPHSLFPDNTKLSTWTPLLDHIGEEVLLPLNLELQCSSLISIWQPRG